MLEQLTEKHKRLAELDATGRYNAPELGEMIGFSTGRINMLRSEPVYLEYRAEISDQIRKRVIEEASNLAEKFDAASPKAFETLVEVCAAADKDSTRLKAADSILDRAPNAPKRTKRDESTVDPTTKILLGVSTFENIQKALTDTENEGILNLIEQKKGNFALPEPENVVQSPQEEDPPEAALPSASSESSTPPLQPEGVEPAENPPTEPADFAPSAPLSTIQADPVDTFDADEGDLALW